jgi:hypothetical protein
MDVQHAPFFQMNINIGTGFIGYRRRYISMQAGNC